MWELLYAIIVTLVKAGIGMSGGGFQEPYCSVIHLPTGIENENPNKDSQISFLGITYLN